VSPLRPIVAAFVAAAALAAVAVPPAFSGASFTATSKSPAGTAKADGIANYLHLYSQSTDPAGLVNYADKRLSNPLVKAATGVDGTLRVALGNWRNGGNVDRVFTIATPAAMPVASITVTMTAALPALGYNGTPATIATIAGAGNGNSGGTVVATLTAGQKRQVNIAIPPLPGLDMPYNATLTVSVTYPGYAGTFLRYDVPVTVYDGVAGGGP
jgi:uncharacterized protein YceK